MAIETFTWCPAPGASGDFAFKVLSAKFGDGYEQLAEDGINNTTSSWPLSFDGNKQKIDQIKAFLLRHRGAKAFLWVPAGEVAPLQFTARDFKVTCDGGDLWKLTTTFVQRYGS